LTALQINQAIQTANLIEQNKNKPWKIKSVDSGLGPEAISLKSFIKE
jgi:hypothetical protein